MNMTPTYNGQYKTKKRVREYNLFWHYATCMLLDYLVLSYNEENLAPVELSKFMSHFVNTNRLRTKQVEEKLNHVIRDLIKLGLVELGGDVISITDEGVKAVRTQNYHNQLAALLESEATRKLALYAFIVSIVSVIITFVAL